MARSVLPACDQIDLLQPVPIADRIWWVGSVHEGDPFQCHVYLIENGDQSVLIDPGGLASFDQTLEKIEQLLPFDHIRYFICHHQDPDITASLLRIDDLVHREDAVIVTHGRASMLIKHYGIKLPFWHIEEHQWCLDLPDRQLQFIFTPYAHFPGAFCTFDAHSGVLFSSDLFGGMADEFKLIVEDESYFDQIRPFHQHYMPSNAILRFALNRLREHPIEIIAPQHGAIIPKPFIPGLFRGLERLDCGLFLLAESLSDIHRLTDLHQAADDITEAMILHRDFCDIANRLNEVAARFLPVRKIHYYVSAEEGVLQLNKDKDYQSELVEPPPQIAELLKANRSLWPVKAGRYYLLSEEPICEFCSSCNRLTLPLFSPENGRVSAVAIFCLAHLDLDFEAVDEVISKMSLPLQVAIERELLYREMDMQRQEMFQRSVVDPLTGLFNRFYMVESSGRMFAIHDRNPEASVGMIMVDLDRFKQVNDTYGHGEGDQVLKKVASLILKEIRQTDMAVRLGGEEFVVFLPNIDRAGCAQLAERLRAGVSQIEFEGPLAGVRVTASFGVAVRWQGEELKSLMGRADKMLYAAKRNGRNQVQTDLTSSAEDGDSPRP